LIQASFESSKNHAIEKSCESKDPPNISQIIEKTSTIKEEPKLENNEKLKEGKQEEIKEIVKKTQQNEPVIEEKKQVKKPKKKKQEAAKETKEDDDDFLNRLIDQNMKCYFKQGCTRNITMMGRQCDYCGQRFCFSHITPEVHGCDDAAKKRAREDFKTYYHKNVLGEKVDKPLNNFEKEQLQKKAKKKISEMEEKRKPVTKQKKDKK